MPRLRGGAGVSTLSRVGAILTGSQGALFAIGPILRLLQKALLPPVLSTPWRVSKNVSWVPPVVTLSASSSASERSQLHKTDMFRLRYATAQSDNDRFSTLHPAPLPFRRGTACRASTRWWTGSFPRCRPTGAHGGSHRNAPDQVLLEGIRPVATRRSPGYKGHDRHLLGSHLSRSVWSFGPRLPKSRTDKE